jgi:thiol-disulfide isomerase/thioredoxin
MQNGFDLAFCIFHFAFLIALLSLLWQVIVLVELFFNLEEPPMARMLVCAVIVLFPSATLLVQGAGEKKADGAAGLKVTGKLSPDDPKDKLLKNPHKAYEFKMEAGKIYVIDLSSKDFDAVLRLENPDGKQVAINDDAEPGTLDSRIVYKAPKDGTYKIIATYLDPSQRGARAYTKPGAYLLTARQGTKEDLAKADPFYNLIGKAAPEIEGMFSLNGDVKKLSALKGYVVLVDFWAVWCGPCIATFPHLRQWTNEFKKDNFEILGVTTYWERLGFDKESGKLKPLGKDDPKLTAAQENDMIKDFAGYHKLAHRLLAVSRDNWKQASKDYKVNGIPQAVLIDRKGIVRMVRVGATPQNAEDLHAEIKKLVAEK